MPITEADSAPARSLAVIGVLTYSAILVGLSLLAAWLISGPVGSTISNCFALVLVMLVGTGRKTLKAAYGTALMSFMAICLFCGVYPGRRWPEGGCSASVRRYLAQ
ncbi:hypothetical protein LZM73_00120 [Pseudomonas aeruginosa]|nr:hypothetical protein [Pseudomonas aeruginosa]